MNEDKRLSDIISSCLLMLSVVHKRWCTWVLQWIKPSALVFWILLPNWLPSHDSQTLSAFGCKINFLIKTVIWSAIFLQCVVADCDILMLRCGTVNRQWKTLEHPWIAFRYAIRPTIEHQAYWFNFIQFVGNWWMNTIKTYSNALLAQVTGVCRTNCGMFLLKKVVKPFFSTVIWDLES